MRMGGETLLWDDSLSTDGFDSLHALAFEDLFDPPVQDCAGADLQLEPGSDERSEATEPLSPGSTEMEQAWLGGTDTAATCSGLSTTNMRGGVPSSRGQDRYIPLSSSAARADKPRARKRREEEEALEAMEAWGEKGQQVLDFGSLGDCENGRSCRWGRVGGSRRVKGRAQSFDCQSVERQSSQPENQSVPSPVQSSTTLPLSCLSNVGENLTLTSFHVAEPSSDPTQELVDADLSPLAIQAMRGGSLKVPKSVMEGAARPQISTFVSGKVGAGMRVASWGQGGTRPNVRVGVSTSSSSTKGDRSSPWLNTKHGTAGNAVRPCFNRVRDTHTSVSTPTLLGLEGATPRSAPSKAGSITAISRPSQGKWKLASPSTSTIPPSSLDRVTSMGTLSVMIKDTSISPRGGGEALPTNHSEQRLGCGGVVNDPSSSSPTSAITSTQWPSLSLKIFGSSPTHVLSPP